MRKRRNLKVEETPGKSFDAQHADPAALGIPLVLRCIFGNLSVHDLVENCSLVNKQWNFESRSFLRDKKTLKLSTELVNSTEDIRFVQNLIKTNAIMFTGLSIKPVYNSTTRDGKLDEEICKLIDTMKLKYVHLVPQEYGYRQSDFSGISIKYFKFYSESDAKIVAHTLKSKCDTIQELSFGTLMPPTRNLKGRHVMKNLIQELTSQDLCFAALKTLKFCPDQEIWAGMMTTIVFPILSMSPTMTNINLAVPFSPSYIPSFSPHSNSVFPLEYAHLFNQFNLKTYARNEWEGLLKNEKLECRYLQLDLYAHVETTLELLGPFLSQNRERLTVFVTNFSTMLSLEQAALLDICMPNMKHLCVQMGKQLWSITEWKTMFSIVSKFPFIFPKLESLAVDGSHSGHWKFPAVEEITGEPFVVLGRRDEENSWGLKRLILRESCDMARMEIFATLFPHVQNLSVGGLREGDVTDLRQIWKCWPFLRTLKVMESNFDEIEFNAKMCGLRASAVWKLQTKKADELLETVIVPEGSCIADMKNLRSLSVLVVNKRALDKKQKCEIPKIFQAFVTQNMNCLTVEFEYIPFALRLGAEEELLF